jgi:hypothetical protein
MMGYVSDAARCVIGPVADVLPWPARHDRHDRIARIANPISENPLCCGAPYKELESRLFSWNKDACVSWFSEQSSSNAAPQQWKIRLIHCVAHQCGAACRTCFFFTASDKASWRAALRHKPTARMKIRFPRIFCRRTKM